MLPHKEEFLLFLQSNHYSHRTIYNYERDLMLFDNFLKEESPVKFANISKREIELYKAYLASRDRKTSGGAPGEKHLEAGSVNRILSSLRRYFKYLIDIDYPVPVAPEAIKLARMPKKHARVAELEALIKLVESPIGIEKRREIGLRNRAMLETLFATGMRISELISLNRDQIDKRGRIFIRGKGRKERFVYLTDRARRCIQDYLETRKDDAPALFIPFRGRNSRKTTSRISPNYLQMKIKQYRDKIGINVPTSAHSLRHGYATYLAEQGANPAAIQILLGHESLHTTTRYINASDRFAEKTHRQFHPLKR